MVALLERKSIGFGDNLSEFLGFKIRDFGKMGIWVVGIERIRWGFRRESHCW